MTTTSAEIETVPPPLLLRSDYHGFLTCGLSEVEEGISIVVPINMNILNSYDTYLLFLHSELSNFVTRVFGRAFPKGALSCAGTFWRAVLV